MQNRRSFLKYAALVASTSIAQPLISFNTPLLPSESKKAFPVALKAGDKVIIVSPAGAVFDSSKIEAFRQVLSKLGFVVILSKSVGKNYGYFAGTDQERADDINNAFADKSIRGVFCTRGGWGCARILGLLDFKMISENPKVIMGFSDITSLLLAISVKANFVTFHGPVGLSSWDIFSENCFKSVIVRAEKNVFPFSASDNLITLSPGFARGELIGGNFTVFNSLIGTEYLPNCEGKILFLEELNEDPYKIDRMFTHLKLAGILDKIVGFIFGVCTKCDAEDLQHSFTLIQVVNYHILPLNIPAIYNAPFGHTAKKWTIPIGVFAELDTIKPSFELQQSAVVIDG